MRATVVRLTCRMYHFEKCQAAGAYGATSTYGAAMPSYGAGFGATAMPSYGAGFGATLSWI